jgi:hypothetical protein
MSAIIGGSGFGPIIGARRCVVHASFRDDINGYATDSVYATIKERAARQNTLQNVFTVMRDVGQRIIALEAARQRAQQRTSRSRCACGRSPCKCTLQQQPRISIGDTAMRNSSLAPSRHLTFDPTSRRARDQQNFSERPSRFTSEVAVRMARHIVGAGPPTARELNEAYHKAWASSGASGQQAEDDTAERQQNAQQARASAAPIKTQYPTGRGKGQRLGTTGINKRGGMLEAVGSDPSEGFASELNAIPSGQPQAALNAYHIAFHKARTPAARDAIDTIWSAYQRR